jgi:prepilin peptidase dependent protein B
MLKKSMRKQAGVSLVETMVGIVIGLFLVFGLMTFMFNNTNFKKTAGLSARMNEEMRITMEFMANDIRRAGYWANASAAVGGTTANPFSTIATGTGCILYSYDYDANGTLTTSNSLQDERYGFVLKTSDGSILMRDPTSLTVPACTSAGISAAVAGTDWLPITDPNEITVTALTFTLTSTTSPSNAHVVIRSVQITMTAQLKADSSVTQTITQTVAIRNDQYV